MALANTYSGKEFAVYMACDASIGTVADGNWANGTRLDVEGITLPGFSPIQEFEMRSGSGRIAEFDQVFQTSKRALTEVTLTGRLTQEVWHMLLENSLADSVDGGTGSDSVVTLTSAYAPANLAHGTAFAADAFENTVSLYFLAPTAADSYTLVGCVCTNFNVSADMGTASGRFDFSATFQTMYAPAKGAVTVSSAAAIGSNQIFLPDLDDKNIDIKEHATSTDEDDIDPIIQSFNLTIDSPTRFLGAQGSNAEPEVIARAVPELSITFGGSLKYDAKTDLLQESFRTSGESYITFYLADVAVAGTTEIPTGVFFAATSVSKFGMWFAKSKLTSCEVSSDDVAMVNFEAKVLAASSGNTAHFLAGDNV